MDRSKVAIVIPAYNESKTIKKVVAAVQKFGDIIIVNDGSSDSTLKECNKMDVNVISHTTNKGYDEALNTGFKEAIKREYEVIITFDADGEHDARDIQRMEKYLVNNGILVKGGPNTSSYKNYLRISLSNKKTTSFILKKINRFLLKK